MRTSLINIDKNAKTVKGQARGYMTGIMYLASGERSGYNVCPAKTEACERACLYTAGRGIFERTQNGRIAKTKMFFEKRELFMRMLETDIWILLNEAEGAGMTPCVRLNGTSDISWEDLDIMQKFPNIQFYDYTKVVERMFKELPANYHLTFSRSDENLQECMSVLRHGQNIAAVFDSANFPEEYWGLPVVNGDQDDLRFLDPTPCIVGLKAKGPARKEADGGGFVLNTQNVVNELVA
jgi:hypothetical protein